MLNTCEVGVVKEMSYFFAREVKMASRRRRGHKFVRNRIRRIVELVYYGAKLSRTNSVLLSLWLLFPLLLFLTSDWIGLLVVFQAMTMAVRMRNRADGKTLVACSVSSMSSKGQVTIVYCEEPQIAAGESEEPDSSLPDFRHSGKSSIAAGCTNAGMFGVTQ